MRVRVHVDLPVPVRVIVVGSPPPGGCPEGQPGLTGVLGVPDGVGAGVGGGTFLASLADPLRPGGPLLLFVREVMREAGLDKPSARSLPHENAAGDRGLRIPWVTRY